MGVILMNERSLRSLEGPLGAEGSELEGWIEHINIALMQGDWAQVVTLTVPLHQCACAMGETQLADLVQDLHWIANDALTHPLAVVQVLQP